MSENVKAGFISLVGRPNVGKSTIMNQLLGQKISITSHKPHTTRHRIHGIRTDADAQYVFVDTPGIHLKTSGRRLNQVLNQTAKSSFDGVDLIVWIVEAGKFTQEDQSLVHLLPHQQTPVILLINKVDKMKRRPDLLPFIQKVQNAAIEVGLPFADALHISAYDTGDLPLVLNCLKSHLPQQPMIFDEAMVTDRNERFLVSEIVREKLMRQLGEEVPYGSSVAIESFDWVEEERRYVIHATIYVEEKGHKPIVIGHNGQRLKQVGMDARRDVMYLLGTKVHLQLWVKVKENWSDDDRVLTSLGYIE